MLIGRRPPFRGWKSRNSRRNAIRKAGFAACEPLEARQLLSATAVSQIPTQTVLTGQTPDTITLSRFLSDPSITGGTVVEMTTPLGNMFLQLTDSQTPMTVANFLKYINNSDYDPTIIQRSSPGFVIQGGGTKPDGSTNASLGNVQGEPGISNTFGTIAMALSSGPNSGTNQWFINLGNNSSTLDGSGDGGPFTAFGNVIDGTMSVATAISALQIIDGAAENSNWYIGANDGLPVLSGYSGSTTPSSVPQNDLVTDTVTTVSGTPTYTAVSKNTNLVNVSITNGVLTLTPAAGATSGTATIKATITDVAGETATEKFTVNVVQLADYSLAAVAQFAAGNGSHSFSTPVGDSSGDLFATNQAGGANGDGAVFEILQGTTTVVPLASFNGTNGSNPEGALVLDSSGDLFGTTINGGANSDGTVFEIVNGSSTITTLASFNATNGKNPYAGLTFDSNGNLFGTTVNGGASSDGAVFEVAHGSNTITLLASFNGTNGQNPYGGVIFDSSGDLLGTAFGGAAGQGAVFEIAQGTTTLSVLAFTGPNGAKPYGNLIIDSSGDIIGTTEFGGTSSDGTVFEIASGTHTITLRASFNVTNGSQPLGGVVLDSSGDIFGTTFKGGANSDGTVFEIPAEGEVTTIRTLGTFNGTNGSDPAAGLLRDSSGNLFGVTTTGGDEAGDGVFFQVTPPHLAFHQPPVNAAAAATLSPAIVVDIENGDNSIDTLSDSNVTIALASDPTGAVLGGTLTVAAVDGVATFSDLSLTVAGTYIFKVSDPTDGFPKLFSESITITPAAVAKLKFSQQPVNAVAGAAINPGVIVKVKDAFGNLISGDTVTLTAVGGGPIISGGSAVSNASGKAIFSGLIIDQAGTYTLSAADGSATGISGTFAISHAHASQLIFGHQPAAAAAGTAISPAMTVKIADAFGNICTNNTSTVTLSIASGPSNPKFISSSVLSVAAVAGKATFSNVALKTAGTYTLNATDGTLPVVTTGSFTVSHAAAAKLVFSVQPTSGAAGSAINPAIVVNVTDAYGNLCPGNSSTITLSIGPGSSHQNISGLLTVAATAGTATFDDVTIGKTGTYTLLASDGSLTAGTSAEFTMS